MTLDPQLANEDYCYLTTKGRVSGRDHTIEIWFALDGRKLYMAAGGRDGADWVKNLSQTPAVAIKLGDVRLRGRARIVGGGDEDSRARQLLFEKYSGRYSGDLTNWRRSALPVAVDLDEESLRGID